MKFHFRNFTTRLEWKPHTGKEEAAAVGPIPIGPLPLKLCAIPFPAYLNYSTLCLVCQEAQFIGINQLNK